MATVPAHQSRPAGAVGLCDRPAARAHEALRPTQPLEVALTSFLARKPVHEFGPAARIVLASHRHALGNAHAPDFAVSGAKQIPLIYIQLRGFSQAARKTLRHLAASAATTSRYLVTECR